MVHLSRSAPCAPGLCRWQQEGLPLTPDGTFPASPGRAAGLPGASAAQAAPSDISRQADQPASAQAEPAAGRGASGPGPGPPAQNGRGRQRGVTSIKVVLPSRKGRRDARSASPGSAVAAPRTAESAGRAPAAAARGAAQPSSRPSTDPGLPDSELARASQVVRAVLKLKVALNFAVPVREEWAPGYHLVIQHPMDLGTVAARLAAGQYANAGEPADVAACELKAAVYSCDRCRPAHGWSILSSGSA